MSMRILVSQTTRMGDVLQTSPLIRAIRHTHPDAHIAILVRRMGRAVAERNPDINQIYVYDEDTMFLAMRAQDSNRLLKAYEAAEAYVQMLRDGHFDMAYNCTHSISSAMLLKLAGIPKVIGAHLSDDWEFVLRGPWTNYFFTSVFQRKYNDLNLCEITRRYIPEAPLSRELIFAVNDADRQYVRELLDTHGVAGGDFVVCFQLGASEDNKRWSEEHFATLAKMLVEGRKARVFLLGVKEESAFGEIFEQHAPGIAVHLFGETSLPQVAGLLERANLLVTNDTGTMHLATAVGCPIVLVSVGYVHFRETGPYGPGYCAIEWRRAEVGRADSVPGALAERTRLRPEQVLRVVDLVLEVDRHAMAPQMPMDAEMANVDVYRTQFAPDGCLQWYPVLRRPMSRLDFTRAAYRAMWLDHLGVQRDPDVERESLALLLGHYAQENPDPVGDWCSDLTAIFEELTEMAERGAATSEELLHLIRLPGGARQAQPSVAAIMALDEEMRLFGELHEEAKPLVKIGQFERDNLEGYDPVSLAETTLQIYQDCLTRARLFLAKVARMAAIWSR
ncbi:MAG: hypothetical protein GWP08_09670 [Nitrospiraceae bacterium]|nr:hypothetical protein [Nitrospiraceae bacterium]